MRPLRALAVALALVAGGAWPVAGPAAPACAGAGPRAGLVVDTGARVHSYCVELDAAEVTGLHLIELAASQHGLSYTFGFGGAAVCRLAGVGPAGSDCFADYPEFWGYWHGTGNGWTWASTGAGSHRLGDGEVDGWVWDDGDAPGTHDSPPATAFDDVCPRADPEPSPTAPAPSPTRTSSPAMGAGTGGGGQGGEGSPAPSDGDPSTGRSPSGSDRPSPSPASTTIAPTDPSSLEAAGASVPDGGGGPPMGLFVAGALGLALVVGGVLRIAGEVGPDEERDYHPGAWIGWASGAGLVAFLTTDPVYLLLVAAASWLVYATHRLEGPESRAFRLFLVAAAVTLALRTSLGFLGLVSSGSLAFAFLEGLRLAAILVVFGTFNAITDPFGVVRLAPRRLHEPALAAALALSIAPRTVASVARVREAQRLRGIHISPLRSLPALAVPVLESGMEQAVTLAESMDARGHGRGRRSRYRPQRWSAPAAAIVASAGLAAVVFLSASFGGWAVLHPSTTPFTWPPVDPVLLGALALLALPGLIPRETRA